MDDLTVIIILHSCGLGWAELGNKTCLATKATAQSGLGFSIILFRMAYRPDGLPLIIMLLSPARAWPWAALGKIVDV